MSDVCRETAVDDVVVPLQAQRKPHNTNASDFDDAMNALRSIERRRASLHHATSQDSLGHTSPSERRRSQQANERVRYPPDRGSSAGLVDDAAPQVSFGDSASLMHSSAPFTPPRQTRPSLQGNDVRSSGSQQPRGGARKKSRRRQVSINVSAWHPLIDGGEEDAGLESSSSESEGSVSDVEDGDDDAAHAGGGGGEEQPRGERDQGHVLQRNRTHRRNVSTDDPLFVIPYARKPEVSPTSTTQTPIMFFKSPRRL